MDNFFNKIKKTDECWLWIAGKNKLGYGRVRFRGKDFLAHRVSYILHIGEIPRGMLVCHRCDNPSCVNPDHLFVGTNKDNTIDCVQKGRFKGYSYILSKMKKCFRGHTFNDINTHIDKRTGKRRCRPCAVIISKRFRRKQNAKKDKTTRWARSP